MTSEQNVPEVESHQGSTMSASPQGGDAQFDGSNVPHGMGQSKSSRRRRRKRKNKGADSPAGAVAGQFSADNSGQNVGSVQAASAPPPSAQGFQNSGGQQANGAPAKRWKKKFRDRDRQRSPENPGNVASGSNGTGYSSNGGGFRDSNSHQPGNGGGFKRKSGGGGGKQQRGPRSFVGPMDHSYRAADLGDGPPSTIQVNASHGRRGSQRHHGDSQPIDHSMPRPVPIPENAQTHIYFFIEELFFQAKIQEQARKLGVKVAFIKNDKDALTELTDSEVNKPALIVVDLNNANAKPLTLIPKLKTKLKRSASIVGFLSHLQGDLKAKAVEVGCDVVMPRAAFSQNLPNLLRRYGVEEEEEVNYNY